MCVVLLYRRTNSNKYLSVLLHCSKHVTITQRRISFLIQQFLSIRYTRNLVDEGNGKFNLMILCWGEGHGTAIHDHANAHCFMKVLQGTLTEVQFTWPDAKKVAHNPNTNGNDQKVLEEKSRAQLELNEVAYINGK